MIVVNFADFKELIDALGGIDVERAEADPLEPLRLPVHDAGAVPEWQGWRFAKGTQHMNGERALIYSRIRENLLDPVARRDVTRGARQQAVIEAVASKLTVVRDVRSSAPFNGELAREAAHDRPLDAASSSQLGWVKFRASGSSSVHCRLGGDLGGGGTGAPSEDNPATIAMFLGKSAPQPPTGRSARAACTGHPLQ